MIWVALGGLGAALAVALGAFGAHALETRLDARSLAVWETAARYLMYASLGLLATGILEKQAPGSTGATGALLAAGAAVFSGSLAALALGGPRLLGAVTPVGGILMIAAFLRLAWGAWRLLD